MPDLHSLVAKPAEYLADADPAVRRLAVSACSGRVTGELAAALRQILEIDPDAQVRAEAAEVLAEIGGAALGPLLQAAHDDSGIVREAAATGLGELADQSALPWLMDAAATDAEKLVREAAVAALGALGDERAVPLLLDLVVTGPRSKPQFGPPATTAIRWFAKPPKWSSDASGERLRRSLRALASPRLGGDPAANVCPPGSSGGRHDGSSRRRRPTRPA
jgi:HEAT repeat protein